MWGYAVFKDMMQKEEQESNLKLFASSSSILLSQYHSLVNKVTFFYIIDVPIPKHYTKVYCFSMESFFSNILFSISCFLVCGWIFIVSTPSIVSIVFLKAPLWDFILSFIVNLRLFTRIIIYFCIVFWFYISKYILRKRFENFFETRKKVFY